MTSTYLPETYRPLAGLSPSLATVIMSQPGHGIPRYSIYSEALGAKRYFSGGLFVNKTL